MIQTPRTKKTRARQSHDMDVFISCQIKRLRSLYGVTALHFDRMTGFSKGTTGRLERNEQKICASHLIRICQSTGIDLSYFYTHTDTKKSLLQTGHELEKHRLLQAYQGIKNTTLKRNIFELIEMLAQTSDIKTTDKG